MARVTSTFPLILLETMRDMDRPDEVFEDEDVSVSLPRRFGLSDVVYAQIQRLQEEVRQRRAQTTTEVENLIRLVARRPDADRIFAEASRRQASHAWRSRSRTARRLASMLPSSFVLRAARRASRRALAELVGTDQLRVVGRPPAVRAQGPLSAQADPSGRACSFYAGVLAELLQHFTRQSWWVDHPECETRGGKACEWHAHPVAPG